MDGVLRRQVRAIPLWLLQEYLEELGGISLGAGQVRGEKWQANLTQVEDHQVGSLRIGQVVLELKAEPSVMERLVPLLEKKLLRAGG